MGGDMTWFWIEIGAALLAVLLLVLAFLVRALAGVVLPRLRLRVAPAMAAPAPYADLFDALDEELAALGFTPRGWVLADFDPPGAAAHRLLRLWVSADGYSIASAGPPQDLARPNLLQLSYSSQLVDGRSLTTSRYNPSHAALASPSALRRNVDTVDVAAQWQAHRDAFAAPAVDARPVPADPRELLTLAERNHATNLDELVAAGRLRADRNGHLRLTAHSIAALLPRVLKALPPVPAAPLPESRQLALYAVHDQIARRNPTRGTQWALFGVSVALFAGLGALVWNLAFAVALILAIAFHEAGHYLAMRLAGYRNLQVLLIPLLGGVATGVEDQPSATRRALVSLMGPLPGIALGWALLLGGRAWLPLPESGFAADVADALPLILLVLNYLNLLPIPPLDGGHFVQSLLPRAWSAVETGFRVLGALGGLALAWALGSVLIGALALWQLAGIGAHRRMGRRERALLAREPGFANLPEPRQRALALAAMADEPGPVALGQRLSSAEHLRQLAALRAPSGLARGWLSLLYLAPFVLPFLLLPFLWPMVQVWAGTYTADREVAAEMEAALAQREAARAAWSREAATLSTAQLIAGYARAFPDAVEGSIALPPATDLPALPSEVERELVGLLALPGAASLGLWPRERHLPVPVALAAEFAITGGPGDPVRLGYDDGDGWRELDLPRADFERYVVIGDINGDTPILLAPADGGAAGVGLIEWFIESPSGYRDLRHWLEHRWIDAREYEESTKPRAM
jgi:Zn-dependent protease